MSTETGYNGWANYPTWCVNLWIDNDEYLAEQARELVEEGQHPSQLADTLKVYVEDMAEQIAPAVFEASFVSDLFGWALSQVDWYELADHYMQDVTA